MSPNVWRTVVDITLNGTFFCAREFSRRHLEADTPGSIVNVGASYAWTGGPGFADSAAAKAGVKNMTETLAVEWGPYGIQVNGLVPGLFPHDDMTDDIKGNLDRTKEKDVVQPALRVGQVARARAGRRPSWRRPTRGSSPGTRSWSTAPTGSAVSSPTRRSSPCASRWARARSSLDRHVMIVDTHVHVVARDEARFPLRPSGVGSQWFREHPVTGEEYAGDGDRGGRRPRGAGAGARCVRERQRLRARCAPGRARPLRGRRDRRSRRRRRARAAPRARGGARVPGRAPVRHRRRAAGLVRRRRRGGALGHRRRPRPPRSSATLLTPDLPRLDAMLARFPGVPVVLDHCGFPDLHDGPPFAGLEPLLALVDHPGLHLKVTSHVLEAAGDARGGVRRAPGRDVRGGAARVGLRLPADPRPHVRRARRARAATRAPASPPTIRRGCWGKRAPARPHSRGSTPASSRAQIGAEWCTCATRVRRRGDPWSCRPGP